MKWFAAILCILLLGNEVKGDVQEVTDSDFETKVLKEGNLKVVSFWAEWCGPCRQVAPSLDAIANEYSGRLDVYKMDIDANQLIPIQYEIRSIPTILVFKDGEVVETKVGALPRSKLESAITPYL